MEYENTDREVQYRQACEKVKKNSGSHRNVQNKILP